MYILIPSIISIILVSNYVAYYSDPTTYLQFLMTDTAFFIAYAIVIIPIYSMYLLTLKLYRLIVNAIRDRHE